ncbi:MAG: N-acetyltransferase family protein [Bacteroidota bacterium]|nr:N-acetyltransferase family protein [Bacteroidota bacterium]
MNTIRLATISDAKSILDIYTPYILKTAFTFETEVPQVQNFEQRIITYQENWPWLVNEEEGVIAGYAYATKHRERAAYQWCVESSVYVHEKFQQKGIAKSLYDTLFEILKYQGYRNVYAGITLPNDKSIPFHKKFGFKWLADYENIGYKLERWNTVSWWHLQLNAYVDNPAMPLKFPDVPLSFLQGILQK